MSSRAKWTLAILSIVSAVAAGAFLLRPAADPPAAGPDGQSSPSGEVSFLMEQQWLIRMKLARAESVTVARQLTSTGRVVPAPGNQAVVAPPVSGILGGGSLPRVGQNVTRGQLLTALVETPTAAEAAQIRAENARLEAEERRLAQAAVEIRARLNLAATEYNRAVRLFEKKAYSLQQLQIAEADLRSAEANLASVTGQLDAFETAPAAATSYPLVAPLSGTIVEVHKSLGEQVEAGEAVFEIIDLNTVWVEAPVFERDLARLRSDSRAVFTTASFPGGEFTGRLVNIGAVIDERTRAATAIFEVANASRQLRIGMQANVRIDAGENADATLIPKEAVLDDEGRKIVYIMISGETFRRQLVELGDEYGDKVAVLAGVKPGERVVTQGAYQLKLQELRPADPGAHTHEV